MLINRIATMRAHPLPSIVLQPVFVRSNDGSHVEALCRRITDPKTKLHHDYGILIGRHFATESTARHQHHSAEFTPEFPCTLRVAIKRQGTKRGFAFETIDLGDLSFRPHERNGWISAQSLDKEFFSTQTLYNYTILFSPEEFRQLLAALDAPTQPALPDEGSHAEPVPQCRGAVVSRRGHWRWL